LQEAMMTDEKKSEVARRAVGEISGEFVLYDTWDPEREDLEPVHFAYVPVVPNRMQEFSGKIRGGDTREANRISVLALASQLRAWTATDLKGEPIDCHSAKEIGARLDNVIVEGIVGRILDSRSTHAAQEQLTNFLKR
jgi:hypothetical protein